MKPLSVVELQNLALELKTFEGSRLQEVRLCRDLLLLGLYQSRVIWLGFDVSSQNPQVLRLTDLSGLSIKDEKKPLILFCRAHLIGARLESIQAPLDLGRVLYLKFNEQRTIEVRLIPRGVNVIVTAAGKSIALHKPTPLKPLAQIDLTTVTLEPHLLDRKSTEWLEAKQMSRKAMPLSVQSGAPMGSGETSMAPTPAGGSGVSSTDRPLARDSHLAELIKKQAKIQKSMASIVADLEKKRSEKWSLAGEWLKANQSLEVPDEFSIYVDVKKSMSFNIENCFSRAKELQKKISGADARLKELQNEFENLQKEIDQTQTDRLRTEFPVAQSKGSANQRPAIMTAAKARGRTFEVSSQNTLFVGKSAEDNLRILRAAKSWYYWLHLRDEPSAHGILTRNKNEPVSQDVLHRAAQILLENNYGSRSSKHYGEKYTVILTECRFVRPIRGDRLGRVNYSNESTFVHLFKNS